MKKIVFVLSLLALTGSVVTSCSKDREEVATKKEDNAITKENLAASGRFVVTTYTSLDENGNILEKEKAGTGEHIYHNYTAILFKKDGTYVVFQQDKPTDKIKEETAKYKLEGNKLIIKGIKEYNNKEEEEICEIVEFVKGKSLKLKTFDFKQDSSGKEQKVTVILDYEVK